MSLFCRTGIRPGTSGGRGMTIMERYKQELDKAEIAFTKIAYDGTEELTMIKGRIRYDAGYKTDRINALKQIALDAINRINKLNNKES